MQVSFRAKLIFSILSIVIISGLINVVVSYRLIGNGIIKQAQDKVKLDINTAREVYQEESEEIRTIVRLTAVRSFVKSACNGSITGELREELMAVMTREALDILSLVDNDGKVIFRTPRQTRTGDYQHSELVKIAIGKREAIVATAIFSAEELAREGPALTEQAKIEMIPTPKAKPRKEEVETSGMVIIAAAPVLNDNNELIGVLYGGKLINRDNDIVDKVKDIVYRGEQFKDRDIGTATIFLRDLRISTNVQMPDGSRAIGTRVSEEVFNKVIEKGEQWIDRAFVVDAWYITAYEPIKDIKGTIVGMLYVGMLEAPYVDLKRNVVYTFLIITFFSVLFLSLIAYLITRSIIQPVKELAIATEKIANGDLTYRVSSNSRDEIGSLAGSFNQMTHALQKATDRYLDLTKTLEKKVEEKTRELEQAQNQIIRSEKLASLGKLAAGIAHEINNPLTSILLNSHLLSENLQGDGMQKDNLQLIIDETNRCSKIVRELLEFSRQSPPEKTPESINEVIGKTLLLVESHLIAHNVRVIKNLDASLPTIFIDANKVEQVFTNVILNALDAMPGGGALTIATKLSGDKRYVEIAMTDTGCGIAQEHLSKIFDPFFTTKGTTGTGLGLAVSYGIVQQHEGTIDIQSELEKGTLVQIRLPVPDRESAGPQKERA